MSPLQFSGGITRNGWPLRKILYSIQSFHRLRPSSLFPMTCGNSLRAAELLGLEIHLLLAPFGGNWASRIKIAFGSYPPTDHLHPKPCQSSPKSVHIPTGKISTLPYGTSGLLPLVIFSVNSAIPGPCYFMPQFLQLLPCTLCRQHAPPSPQEQ